MTPQPAGPAQLPIRDPMYTNQGTGPGMVNLGQLSRQWIGAFQGLQGKSSSGGSVTAVDFVLATGANTLTPVELGLPTVPTGFAVIILEQPGDATITWSSDFVGTVNGIDATAGTGSVFLFAAFGTQWVMVSYPTTGVTL